MAEYAKLPKIGLTMKTGIVSTFLVAVGDTVKKGDVVAEFETDKITGEVESPADGTVLELLVSAGDEVEVLAPLMLIGSAGEAAAPPAAPAAAESQIVSAPAAAAADMPAAAVSAKEGWVLAMPMARFAAKKDGIDLAAVQASSKDGIIRMKDVKLAAESGTVRATPLAKKIAADNGVDLKSVAGTGPNGRVGKDDVLGAMASAAPARVSGGETRKKMSGMRRVIAERLAMSKQTIPHVYFKSEMDATALLALKDALKDAHAKGLAPKVTVNDILLKAVATVLAGMPEMCAQLDGDEIVYFDDVNIGMAVSVENGLVVPVVKAADKLPLSLLAKETAALTEKARDGKLLPEDFKGGNFTVSNLGASGIDEFSAIINPPEAAILAVGAAKEKAVAVNGEVVIRPMMTLTISVDHRLIDGALAAEFMKRLKETVENIYLALI